jgi:hypothetical protein
MSLAGVLVLEFLQGQASPFKDLVVHLQMKLHLAIGEDVV